MRALFTATRRHLVARPPPHGVVTRLAPSVHVAGCQGVFLTTDIKKFTPIEVEPSAASAHEASVVQAPPYVCNLALAPRRTVSLRRFLALRHSFCHGTYLHVATEGGWYLLTPSAAVPLADVDGLRRWQQRHHHRYRPSPPPTAGASTPRKEARMLALRRRAYEDLAKAESEELSEDELQAMAETIAAEEAALKAKDDEESGTAEMSVQATTTREEDTAPEEDPDDTADGTEVLPSSSPVVHKERAGRARVTAPPLIPEAHLFQLNDAIYWPLPPADDVTEPAYWADHRLRMRLYQDTNTIRPEDHEQFLADALEGRLRTPPSQASEEDKAAFVQAQAQAASGLTQKQMYALSEEIYRTATRKANAAVHVDDTTGLVVLVPLMDLEAGTELVLHYGREWWLQRLLSMVLLAVPDAQMPRIRWIEGVCGGHKTAEPGAPVDDEAELDSQEPFPQLILARRQARRRSSRRHGTATRPEVDHADEKVTTGDDPARTDASGETAPTRGKRVLFNLATRDRATDAQVLAFAVRRSCVDREFYAALMFWRGARRRRSTGEVVLPAQAAVFSLETPDKEVPISALRQALIRSLESERLAAETDSHDVLEDVAALTEAESNAQQADEARDKNQEETFSV